MDLEAQRDQLRALAKAQKIDLKPYASLPADPRMQTLALATLLGIDPMEALRGTTPVKKLVSEARKQQRVDDTFEKEELEQLHELGIKVGRPPRRKKR
jgi:hypothetical protein